MTQIEISFGVRADAALRLADLERQRAAAAKLTDPVVVLPKRSPKPVPPTEDEWRAAGCPAVMSTPVVRGNDADPIASPPQNVAADSPASIAPVLVTSERLRSLIDRLNAREFG